MPDSKLNHTPLPNKNYSSSHKTKIKDYEYRSVSDADSLPPGDDPSGQDQSDAIDFSGAYMILIEVMLEEECNNG